MFGINIRPLDVIRIAEKEQLDIGSEFTFQVFHTPGHSNGSVCYYEQDKKILIPGDLIFTGGSFGRYDFPGGSLSLLINSIKRMNDLDIDFLLPGHMSIGNGNGNQQIALSYKMVQSIGTYFQ
jgi:glyoxylase-like metal-dependent hydrolase (beta-lactamase superfamily II)